MRPWLSAAVGVLAGYMLLALAVLWLRNLCLPVSANESKWQCAVSFWVVALAYFGSSFVAAFFARRRAIAVGLVAFAALFIGHAVLPDLAIVSFGKRLYLNEYTLLFAVIPSMIALAAAAFARRKFKPQGL